jgi:hypothetical protein
MILSAPIVEAPTPPSNIPTAFFDAKARELAQYIVLGVDTPLALGTYLGLTSEQCRALFDSAYFKVLLAEAQGELKDANLPTEKARAMARLAAPEAVTTLISLARNADDSKVSRDAAESLLNIAGVQTKTANVAQTGPQNGIAISISFAAPPLPQPITVNASRQVIEHE